MSTYKGNGFKLPQLPGYFPRVLTSVFLLALLFAAGGTSVEAQKENGYWYKVQQIEAGEVGISRIAGIAYDAPSGALILVEESPDTSSARFWTIDRYGNLIGLQDIPLEEVDLSVQDPSENSTKLFLLDAPQRRLLEIQTGADQILSEVTPRVKKHPDRPFGVSDLLGVSSDPVSGKLFFLDSDGPAILSVLLFNSDEPGSGADQSQQSIKRIPLHGMAGHSLKGLAYHPDRQHFYIYSESVQMLFAFDQNGQVQETLELSELGIVDLQGMVFADSTDPTDDSRQMNLFLAAGGELSSVIEISLTEIVPLASLPNPMPITLAQIIDTSRWSPSSPDTSGLEYMIGSNRLFATDSEVEEMSIYQGKNTFTATNTGVLTASCTTLPFSYEPTGVAVNPNNNHIFITDDNYARVYEINPGADNVYCSGDDTYTFFKTTTFNSSDPEGIAYGAGLLYIVDGIGAEVYILSPGVNGIFDGGAPGDDIVSHFDSSGMGLRDPEGIGFHWYRGTVFMVSYSDNIAVEANKDGGVLNIYDFSASSIVSPAGAAIGPGSINPAVMNLYVSDRGVDNGTNPHENDGKIFEYNLPGASPVTPTHTPLPSLTTTRTATSAGPTHTPTVTSTATQTLTPTPTSTPTPIPTPLPNPIYISLQNAGPTTVGNLSGVSGDDVIYYDGVSWSMVFDASDVGLTSLVGAVAFPSNGSVLLSLTRAASIAPIGRVYPQDILLFTPTSLGQTTAGAFSLYFDGSDVGLEKNQESIKNIFQLSDGRLLLSTKGTSVVPGLTAGAEDLIAFTPQTLSSNTTGTWAMYFDGSDVGMSATAAIDALAVADNNDLYLSTAGIFTLGAASGDNEDVLSCTPSSLGITTACAFAPNLYFDGSLWGLAADNVDGIGLP